MLVRLLPKDIDSGWDVISKALETSVPEHVNTDDIGMSNLLLALMDDKLQCWLISGENFQEEGMLGIVTTLTVIDPPSGTRNLLIYSLTAFKTLTQEIINDGYETLKNYAKSKDCFKIIAYTDVPRIEQMVLALGGTKGHTLVELEV